MIAELTVKAPQSWDAHNLWKMLVTAQVTLSSLLRDFLARPSGHHNTPAGNTSTDETIVRRLQNMRLHKEHQLQSAVCQRKNLLTNLQRSGVVLQNIRQSSRKAKAHWLGLEEDYSPVFDTSATKVLIAWYYVLSMAPPTGTTMDKLLEPDVLPNKHQPS